MNLRTLSWWRHQVDLIHIRIAQIAFHCKILSEAVQSERLHVSRLADPPISSAQGKGNRTHAREDLRRIVKENLVHDARRKRRPIDHRSAFDDEARDLAPAENLGDTFKIWTTIGGRRTAGKDNGAVFRRGSHRDLLHDDASGLQLLPLVLLGETAEDDEVLTRGLDHA